MPGRAVRRDDEDEDGGGKTAVKRPAMKRPAIKRPAAEKKPAAMARPADPVAGLGGDPQTGEKRPRQVQRTRSEGETSRLVDGGRLLWRVNPAKPQLWAKQRCGSASDRIPHTTGVLG